MIGAARRLMATSSCVVLEPSVAGFTEAGKRLRDGGCVAFPTETVYGLGANALDESAIGNIFKYKARPASDPLIVHVLSVDDALKLVDLDADGTAAFRLFADKFWPGPLTIVAKAAPVIPSAVTAGTGFVGLRSPNHPIARQLLEAADVPVAAPSANRFCHVSPTQAAHVVSDLGEHPIAVINGEADGSEQSCGVGVESTVMKLDVEAKKVVLFRKGGMPIERLRAATEEVGYAGPEVVTAAHNHNKMKKGVVAPGQMLTHYAPDKLTAFMVVGSGDGDGGGGGGAPAAPAAGSGTSPSDTPPLGTEGLSAAIVVDFGGQLAGLKDHAVQYVDLSDEGKAEDGCRRVFSVLRSCEGVEGARYLLMADPSSLPGFDEEGIIAALRDRLFRAASGKKVCVDVTTDTTAPSVFWKR